MKGVWASGLRGRPSPLPVAAQRRGLILEDTAPRALPPRRPCAPRSCALQSCSALNGPVRTGSLVPAAVGGPGLRVHLTVGEQPSLTSGLGSNVAAPVLASGQDAERDQRGGAARAAGRSAPSPASQPFAQVWQTREPGFPAPEDRMFSL